MLKTLVLEKSMMLADQHEMNALSLAENVDNGADRRLNTFS